MPRAIPPPPPTTYAPISGEIFIEMIAPSLGVGSEVRRYHIPAQCRKDQTLGIPCQCGEEVVLLRNTLLIQGWLRVEVYLGRCPECRAWLWG